MRRLDHRHPDPHRQSATTATALVSTRWRTGFEALAEALQSSIEAQGTLAEQITMLLEEKMHREGWLVANGIATTSRCTEGVASPPPNRWSEYDTFGSSRSPVCRRYGDVVPMPTVILRPGRERSLHRRHPWIFSGGVGHVAGDPAPGDTVVVQSVDRTVLGLGAYSPASQIRVRMWTFDADTEVDDEFVHDRIVAAAARARRRCSPAAPTRPDWCSARPTACPGVIADRYDDTDRLSAHHRGRRRAARRRCRCTRVRSPVSRRCYERSDADVREREALEPTGRSAAWRRACCRDRRSTRATWRYAVDVTGGHKTGFYLDQRDARSAIARLANGSAHAERVLVHRRVLGGRRRQRRDARHQHRLVGSGAGDRGAQRAN